jgi:hypothetical protein
MKFVSEAVIYNTAKQQGGNNLPAAFLRFSRGKRWIWMCFSGVNDSISCVFFVKSKDEIKNRKYDEFSVVLYR